jgi:hypothetical protein
VANGVEEKEIDPGHVRDPNAGALLFRVGGQPERASRRTGQGGDHRSEPTISPSQVCSDCQRAQHRDKSTEAEPKSNVRPKTVWSLTDGEEHAE